MLCLDLASRCPWCTKEISFTGLGFGTFLIYILQALYPCSDEFSSNKFLMTVWHSLTHVCFWNSFHLSEHQATSLLGVSTEAWPGHWTTSSFWYCTARRGVGVVVVFKPLGKSWETWKNLFLWEDPRQLEFSSFFGVFSFWRSCCWKMFSREPPKKVKTFMIPLTVCIPAFL